MVPVGVRRRAALGRHDDVAISVAEVRQRIRPPGPGPGARVRQQQERLSREGLHLPFVRTELLDDPAIPVRHLALPFAKPCPSQRQDFGESARLRPEPRK